MSRRRRWEVGAAALLVLPMVAGCGSTGTTTAGHATGGTISVVASTDVWGDIAHQIAGHLAGSKVRITSIISDPNADPHTYEASARTQLAVSQATVVIENGGGYDDFLTRMVASANTRPTVLNAVTISGKTAPAGGSLNEHVWYDFPTVQKVAQRITEALATADPADAATFRRNDHELDRALRALEATEATIKAADAGDDVAITEPVPLYLLDACGLDNVTPPAFSEAIEEDSDVSPAVLHQTLQLFSSHKVKLLAYNEQTTGPITAQVLAAAKSSGVAVVPVTETLPQGKDYLTWMRDNLAAVRSALK